jgi:hypothetical protein
VQAAVLVLTGLVPKDAEDDEMRDVAQHNDGAEEKNWQEPRVPSFDSARDVRRECGYGETKNVEQSLASLARF